MSGVVANNSSRSSGVIAATAAADPTHVQFPATQVASADVNRLDDYEEGTFDPDLIAATNNDHVRNTRLGFYTKIGNLVTFSSRVTFSSTANSDAVWGGLPFAEGKGNLECGGNATWVGVDINTGTTLYPRITNGATTFSFYAAVDNGSWNNTLTTADTAQIAFFGFYYVA